MRTVLVMGSFLGLLFGTCVLWSHRFRRDPDLPALEAVDIRALMPAPAGGEWVNDGKGLRLAIKAKAGSPSVSVRLPLESLGRVEGLHLRFKMSAGNLIQPNGMESCGSFHAEWHGLRNGVSLVDYTNIALVYHDTSGAVHDLVVRPPEAPSPAVLCLGISGTSGELGVTDLTVTPVHERGLWIYGRWFLAIGWIGWVMACARFIAAAALWKTTVAALIWVTIAGWIVIPGPWDVERSLIVPFQLGPVHPSRSEVGKSSAIPAEVPGAVPVAKAGENAGPETSVAKELKRRIVRARHLLHVFLFYGIALAIGLLVGVRAAAWLVGLLAPASELSQAAFGYGFGWEDVGDLVTDGLGILLAAWTIRWLIRRGVRWSSSYRRRGC